MVRNPIGESTRTSSPQRSSQRTVFASVTTTPLICGAQASVTRRIRKLCSFEGDGAATQSLDRLPVDDSQLPGVELHQRGEALDPVAAVAVEDPADVADLRLVYVAADHAVEASPARLGGERVLEGADVAHRVLHALLEELREGPVRETQARARVVEPAVHLERQHVEPVAQIGEPLRT